LSKKQNLCFRLRPSRRKKREALICSGPSLGSLLLGHLIKMISWKNKRQISNIFKRIMMKITIMIRMDIMMVMSMLIHSCRGRSRRWKVSNRKKKKKLRRSQYTKMINRN
jgi:hypothetical protein